MHTLKGHFQRVNAIVEHPAHPGLFSCGNDRETLAWVPVLDEEGEEDEVCVCACGGVCVGVWVWVCVCVWVGGWVRVRVHVRVWVCARVCGWVGGWVGKLVCVCAGVRSWVGVRVYVCVCVRVFVFGVGSVWCVREVERVRVECCQLEEGLRTDVLPPNA